MKRLRPFFKYYGAKWKLAPKYPAPRHDTIVEPFAGAAGYSLLHPDRRVILVEKYPVLAGIWRYLIKATPGEIMRLPDLRPGQAVDDLEIPQEARWLIGFRINAATATPARRPGKWMREEPDSIRFWGPSARAMIAGQVDAIRHWQVIEGEYSAAPHVAATWFVDPPYQGAGVHYKHGSALIDYAQLGEWCRTRQGEVMVCENIGASWLPFEPFVPCWGAIRYTTEALWHRAN